MGTLCKNCPFKGSKSAEGSCTELFVKKYHNSCVTYDISENQFLEELKIFEEEKDAKKAEEPSQEIASDVTDTTIVEENKGKKPKAAKKTSTKKSKKIDESDTDK